MTPMILMTMMTTFHESYRSEIVKEVIKGKQVEILKEVKRLVTFCLLLFNLKANSSLKTSANNWTVCFSEILTLDRLILEDAILTLWRALSVYLAVSNGLCHPLKQWIHSSVHSLDTTPISLKVIRNGIIAIIVIIVFFLVHINTFLVQKFLEKSEK